MDTSVHVGTGAVTGNVIVEFKVVVDHTIDDADYDGACNVSSYPRASCDQNTIIACPASFCCDRVHEQVKGLG